MKLRNKETREIRKAEAREDGVYLYDVVTERWWKYELSLLASGWEYYVEPERKSVGARAETGEKRKAWKRLKDKGFRFDGVEVYSKGLLEIDAVLPALEEVDYEERIKMIDDLHLLFGEEEE